MSLRPTALLLFAGALLAARTAAAAEELWHVVKINGNEAGHMCTRTEPEGGGFSTSVDNVFRMARMGTEIVIEQSLTQVEDARGQVVAVRERSLMAKSETLYDGVVKDGVLEFTTTSTGKPRTDRIEWPEDMPGPEEIRRRILATGLAPGAEVKAAQFEFLIGRPIGLTMRIVGPDRIELAGVPRTLTKIVAEADLEGIPEVTSWVDERGESLRTETTMVGVAMVTELADAATVARIKEGGTKAAAAEVFNQSMIGANVRLPRPRSLTAIEYRLAPKAAGVDLPALEDERQHVRHRDAEGGAIVLEVRLVVPGADRRQRRPLADSTPELAEFLTPNSMLESDDPVIQDLAASTVGDETDAWAAAQLLERRVYGLIAKKSFGVGFASALETCQTREGDCSEHAVLLAALCRAAGIPARVAMGLVYVGGIFGGHAWTEVSIDGTWYALDATLGRGSADPTHIRMGASSLKGGGMADGFLGVMQGLGNLDLTILAYEDGARRVEVSGASATATVADGFFADPVEGVRFRMPHGFDLGVAEPEILAMNRDYTLAKLTAANGAIIEVAAHSVPFDATLERWMTAHAKGLGDGKGRPTSRTIAGRDGSFVLCAGDEQSGSAGLAAVLIADSLYSVEGRGLSDEQLDELIALLETLEIAAR